MERRRRQRRGFALLQVMIIVGVAMVLSFALLAETSLQTQVSGNAYVAAQADTLAESGVNLANYYLLNPWKAPSLQNGYWPGETGISLGSGAPGTIDVAVMRDAANTNEYVVTSTGRPGGALSAGVAHTVTARVRIAPGFKITRAIASAKGLQIMDEDVTITGNVAANAALVNVGTINGIAYAASFANSGTITAMLPISSTEPAAAPTKTTIQTYGSYVYPGEGVLRSRTTIALSAIGSGVMENLGPTATNPAGIYWRNGDLTVNNNLTINGTLVVNGNLILNGTNISITAADGFPALIVLGEFRTRSWKTITINGTTYIDKVVKAESGVSLSTSLVFNGALLFGDNGAFNTGSGTWIRVDNRLNQSKQILPDLDTANPRSVTVLSWS